MKHTVLSLTMAGAMLAISSCHTGSSTTGSTTATPASPTMNATETSLLGTWLLKKREVVVASNPAEDTTTTGYDNSWYVQFTSEVFEPNGPLNYKKARASFINNASVGTIYWYYDPAVSKLVIGTQYDIITQTSSSLVIRTVTNTVYGYSITYYFEK